MEPAATNRESVADPGPLAAHETHEEPPAGKLERAIAQIWKETFRVEHIGRNTDFFELGGDSLIGMDLIEKISLYVGLELPFVILFQHPTPRQLARYINALRYAGGNGPSDTSWREQQSAEDDIEFLLAMPDSQAALLLRHLRWSRARFRQDLFVLSERQFERNGFFVELGATDGVNLSNTYLLEKGFGWRGILAEACRGWHQQLLANRRAAVETRYVWRESGAILSFEEPKELAGASPPPYDLETISLNDLLERHNAPAHIDYLSIEAGGRELDILSRFDFARYHFAVITCEHNFAPAREELHDLLKSQGYVRKYQDISKVDDWYVSAR